MLRNKDLKSEQEKYSELLVIHLCLCSKLFRPLPDSLDKLLLHTLITWAISTPLHDRFGKRFLLFPDSLNKLFLPLSDSFGRLFLPLSHSVTGTWVHPRFFLSLFFGVRSVLLILFSFLCFVCLHHVYSVPNIATFSGLLILDCPFDFL